MRQEISIKNRAKTIHDLRVEAQNALDEAKEIMGTDGISDYYDAVKEYYKTVSVWYSKLTYSGTVADHKANCADADAYAELDFYT